MTNLEPCRKGDRGTKYAMEPAPMGVILDSNNLISLDRQCLQLFMSRFRCEPLSETF